VYFKKESNARLLVLGFVGALIFLLDKPALGQWVLMELRFPSVSILPTVAPYSLTFPADTLGPPYTPRFFSRQSESTTEKSSKSSLNLSLDFFYGYTTKQLFSNSDVRHPPCGSTTVRSLVD